MIFKYSSALWAAEVCASLELVPDPKHTATGKVDSWTKHWYFPRDKDKSKEEAPQLTIEIQRQAGRMMYEREGTMFPLLHP